MPCYRKGVESSRAQLGSASGKAPIMWMTQNKCFFLLLLSEEDGHMSYNIISITVPTEVDNWVILGEHQFKQKLLKPKPLPMLSHHPVKIP